MEWLYNFLFRLCFLLFFLFTSTSVREEGKRKPRMGNIQSAWGCDRTLSFNVRICARHTHTQSVWFLSVQPQRKIEIICTNEGGSVGNWCSPFIMIKMLLMRSSLHNAYIPPMRQNDYGLLLMPMNLLWAKCAMYIFHTSLFIHVRLCAPSATVQ